MHSTLTVDGVTITGDIGFISTAYEAITKIIRSGEVAEYLAGRTEGDYRIRTAFLIQPTTKVSATLAYSPVDGISGRYEPSL